MINNTPLWYIFIRTCVIFLHYLTPTCILYAGISVALRGLSVLRNPPLPILAIEVLAIAETLFYICFFLPYRRYFQNDGGAQHPATLSRSERKALFEKCNAQIRDCDSYLSKWLLGADPKEIKRGNLEEFILWAFLNRHGPAGDDKEEVEEYILLHERTMGRRFEEGYNTNIRSLRLTLEKVDMLHRSLVWFFCVFFVDMLTYINLSFQGFRHYRAPLPTLAALFPPRPYALASRYTSPVKTSYWYRPHTSKTKLPVLFIHGIGIGLYPYTNFLGEINASVPSDETIGVIAIEILPISFRLSPAPLSSSALSAEIAKILELHGFDSVVLAAHSYGSVIATHLLHDEVMKTKIADLLLIDPVSLLLHLPDVAYNFVKRKPRTAAEWQLWYFASMDLGVARALGRFFFWNECVVWKEDFMLDKRRVTVSLAGRDLIVDTEAVGRYLASSEEKDGGIGLAGGTAESQRRLSDEGYEYLEDEHADQSPGDERASLFGESWKHAHWRGEGLEVLWFEHLDHAQVFDKTITRARLVEVLRTYCAGGERGNGVRMNGKALTNGNDHAKSHSD